MKMRAIVSIVGIFAFVFGLLAATAAHVGATSSTQRIGLSCHDRDTIVASVEHGAPDENGAKKPISCPCCLAAHAGPAVLPERFALLMRVEPMATPAVYRSSPKLPPHVAPRQTVNGARAPPDFALLA